MKLETAQKIVAASRELDADGEVSLRDDYSGRGMFGKTTAAVVGSKGDILTAVAHAAYQMGRDQLNPHPFLTDVARLSWDSMGKSDSVAY